MSRTIIDFTATADAWPEVDSWASRRGYALCGSDADRRRYKKGGFLLKPVFVEIQQTGRSVHLEAYVKINWFTRLGFLFLIPGEMEIRGGGFIMALPRTAGNSDVNELLKALGQPMIP